MREKREFYREMLTIVIPVALQNMLQSSFGVVDQIMAGQLGSTSIAAIGLASKFSSIYSVLVSAVAAAAGIMTAQYIGGDDSRNVGKSFYVNLMLSFVLAIFFTSLACFMPSWIMEIYTRDGRTIETASKYLKIVGMSYVPMAASSILSVLLRCRGAAQIPLLTGAVSALANTALNYVLIFGTEMIPAMGAEGAALATVLSQGLGCLMLAFMSWSIHKRKGWKLPFVIFLKRQEVKQYGEILLPVFICELFWSLGENVYASIYGHLGTEACAAMTLTTPVQILMMGILGGLSQAAGIMIGKNLGSNELEKAYRNSIRLMVCGAWASILCSLLIAAAGPYYTAVYQVEESVRETAQQILVVFALAAPVKVGNMILGGGIIRSGGKTRLIMAIDIIGTWMFGVPLGIFSAFVLHMPVALVYLMLSLEECVRFLLSLWVFRKKIWMQHLTLDIVDKKI